MEVTLVAGGVELPEIDEEKALEVWDSACLAVLKRCRVGFWVRGWKCGAHGMCVDHGNKLRKSSEISHVSRRVRS